MRDLHILGILNITPDSFSDGGQFFNPTRALHQAETLIQQGAHTIDIGGESTRPGATPVAPDEEQRRILPIIAELSARGHNVSVDTLHAETAEAAVRAGATIINDVSGGLHDPDMLPTIGKLNAHTPVQYILGHWRGIPDTQHRRSHYTDVVAEVSAELLAQATRARTHGVPAEQLIIDPGLGFDKDAPQSWQLLGRAGEIGGGAYPVLIGASRKRMIAETLRDPEPSDPREKLATLDLASAVASVLAAQQGAWGVRVHNVAATTQALAVAATTAAAIASKGAHP